MSNILNKVKDKVSHSDNNNSEPTYSIQPHPNPNDSANHTFTGNDPIAAHHAKGPHIPSKEIRDNLEKPLNREELRARQEELNRGN
ncbi:hypothetical protein E1B28_005977 [Marasmius oreades]|uniref:Uncharacterized protein n=1 Tax=Marasmius oreades TaxID=181124 RepID=A0A9P7S487_9AGAR|nr:uncharacterized protein E1B28_005977 [Marasmius oreades]KAG7095201.1 hypothetical protein E1B28_005977 [Marasmius oreades]